MLYDQFHAIPEELTIDEIQVLIEAFGDAAKRADAGFGSGGNPRGSRLFDHESSPLRIRGRRLVRRIEREPLPFPGTGGGKLLQEGGT